VLYGSAWMREAPVVLRVVLLVPFFLPCRAGTLHEVCRRRRAHLSLAHLMAVPRRTLGRCRTPSDARRRGAALAGLAFVMFVMFVA
jgi:hypothetical protein